jgi:hypothetical protein
VPEIPAYVNLLAPLHWKKSINNTESLKLLAKKRTFLKFNEILGSKILL